MNIIYKLFNEQYLIELFAKEVLPLYPDFKSVKKVTIQPHKEHIWEETYHVVLEFKTTFLTQDGKNKILPIYCSAHSDEPRKNVYDSLRYLWQKSFGKGYLSIPHPLFYSEEFSAIFYRGVKGRNLYQYIREKKFDDIENIVSKAAAWFAKLHNLDASDAQNFNPQNSKIKTVIPGVFHILERIKKDYPDHFEIFKKMYDVFIQNEENFLSSTSTRWLVHGDAHPENIIKMSVRKIGVIDFTDLCLADFSRDIGAFLQQLDYMCGRKIADPDY